MIQVLEYAALPEHINSLVLRLKKIEEDSSVDPTNRRTAREQTLELKNLANQVQHRSKTNPFETVANAIQLMATDKFADYITTNTDCSLTVRQIINSRLTARFAFSSNEGEVSRQLNRVVVRQFTTIAMSPEVSQDLPKILLVDEASEVICDALGTLVSKGAGRSA